MIVYCQCTHSEQENQTKRCIEKVQPYVNRVVIIHDDTVLDEFKRWLESRNCEHYFFSFNDNFSENRNHYLDKVNIGDWVLCSDPDEEFSIEGLNNLRRIIEESENGEKYNMVRFNGELVIMNTDGTETNYPSDWYKFLLFKMYSRVIHYAGILHETVVGTWKEINVPYKYFHYKTQADDIERSARNFFIVGGGPNDQSEYWRKWRNWLSKELNITTWREMKTMLRQGSIPAELKSWIISIKDKHDYIDSVDNEIRKFYNYYFEVLHPEEITDVPKE